MVQNLLFIRKSEFSFRVHYSYYLPATIFHLTTVERTVPSCHLSFFAYYLMFYSVFNELSLVGKRFENVKQQLKQIKFYFLNIH